MHGRVAFECRRCCCATGYFLPRVYRTLPLEALRRIPISQMRSGRALAITKEPRLYLSGIARSRSLSKEPLHVLATYSRPSEYVRFCKSSDLQGAIEYDEHAPSCAHHTQRSNVGRGSENACSKSMQVSTDLEERLVYAFRQVVSRQPTHEDLQALTRTLNRQKQIYQADAESAKALVSVGESSRDESLDVVDHAAMSAVCLAIFNLDEAMSRE